MELVFLKILNMSLTASWLICVIALLRLGMKKTPKWIRCALWVLVAVRLVCPISLESAISLIPSAQTVPPEILYAREPVISSGIPAVNHVVNPMLGQSFAPNPADSVNPLQVWTFIAANLWILGILAMLVYALISYWQLRRRVQAALRIRDNIWICDDIQSPFLLGIVKPRIYLPSTMEPAQQDYVIAHEQAHVLRRDHWWKPLGFTVLMMHWFNPLVWLAYILLCRDIELACDEKVIKRFTLEDKKAYSQALLCCSISRRRIAACPLAFGEVGVKERVKSVLNYKKPAFWVILVALLVSVALAVCFLTNPPQEEPEQPTGFLEQTDQNGVALTVRGIFWEEERLHAKAELYNGSENEITYGPQTLIYRDDVCITPEDMVWPAMTGILEPGGKAEIQVDLSQYSFDQPGVYRMEKECFAADDDEAIKITAVIPIYVEKVDTPISTFQEGEFSVETGEKDEITQIATYWQDGNTHGIYFCGISEVYITDDAGQKHSLEELLNSGSMPIDWWMTLVEQQSTDVWTMRDGGSVEFVLDGFHVLKCHRLTGPQTYCQDIYIFADTFESWQIFDTLDRKKPNLTLDDVIRLAKQDVLTPEDFAGYQYQQIGSGLDIWQLEIDGLFTLRFNNMGMDVPLEGVFMAVRDGTDEIINICTDNVKAFINKHEGNPIVPELLRGYVRISMGDSQKIMEKMQQLGAPYMEPGSEQVLPFYPVGSAEDLQAFREAIEKYFNYSDSYENYLTFDEAVETYYNEEFFETKEVMMVYYSGQTGQDAPKVDYVRQYEGNQLRISITAAEKTFWKEKTGWLLMIELDKGTLASSESAKVILRLNTV